MGSKDNKRLSLPILLALGSLILLILLLGFYFENCLKKNVLGVSTFNSSFSKNPVTDGDTFNFAATVVGDQSGALNATVLFNLTGAGVINSNIQGPGTCLKLTDTTAACNNVNIDPNQTIVWTVPITADTNCSQASGNISLQTRLVATAVVSTSTASVNCVAKSSAGGVNATTTPTSQNNGNATPNNGSTTGTQTKTTNKVTTSAATPTPMATLSLAGLACSKFSGIPLIFLLFILWLLASAYYFIFRKS